MSAKVDSAAVQDGYQLYHHNFFFTGNVHGRRPQGMNEANHFARRYHWLSESLVSFVMSLILLSNLKHVVKH